MLLQINCGVLLEGAVEYEHGVVADNLHFFGKQIFIIVDKVDLHHVNLDVL